MYALPSSLFQSRSKSFSLLFCTLLFAVFAGISAPALAVYKCDAGGTVSYSDIPCTGGRQIDIKDVVSPADAAQADQRARQQKAELKRIDAARSKSEAQEAKTRSQLARAGARKKKHCALLAIRKKATEDSASIAAPKAVAKAKIKMRHDQEKYEVECGSASNGSLQARR